jgi:hypothetical protein
MTSFLFILIRVSVGGKLAIVLLSSAVASLRKAVNARTERPLTTLLAHT